MFFGIEAKNIKRATKMKIQQILSCYESINDNLSVFLDNSKTDYYVYIGVCLLECVSINPEDLRHKMLIGRLYNGGAKLNTLSKSFQHDPRTISAWGNALKSNNLDEMAQVFAGRSAQKKVTPHLIKYVCQQYKNRAVLGRNYRQKIINLTKEVFDIEISASLASEIFKKAKETEIPEIHKESTEITDSEDVIIPEIMATPEQLTHSLSSKNASTVQQSPCFPFMEPNFLSASEVTINHAGLVLFGYFLKMYDSFQCQLICQLLQGAVNIESSKSLCADSLKFFCEKIDRVLNTQREKLDICANDDSTLELYAQNSKLLSDGPNNGDVFFFDPHTKKYTGQLNVLKDWCGSAHTVTRVINLDSFHTLSGRPCYIKHYSPYYDMRERFFMSLNSFDKLFDEDKRTKRTFIIDRGIYGLECFKRFDKDYLITWEKNYDQGGWVDEQTSVSFTRVKQKNRKGYIRVYRFECQQSIWTKDSRFRRILVKATNHKGHTIMVSILCSNPNMSIQDAVWFICCRWLQENDFKYLDINFGINQLDSRAHFDFSDKSEEFTDKEVERHEYKQLKKDVRKSETALAKHLLKLNKAESKLDRLSIEKSQLEAKKDSVKELKSNKVKCKKCKTQIDKLVAMTSTLENDLTAAVEKQSSVLRNESKIQQLMGRDIKLIDTRRKAYMDALRVNASNIFRNVHEDYRTICNNFRDDHLKLRMLSRCAGVIRPSSNEITVNLWLPGSIQNHVIKSMEVLLKKVETDINKQKPKGTKDLRLGLISGPMHARSH